MQMRLPPRACRCFSCKKFHAFLQIEFAGECEQLFTEKKERSLCTASSSRLISCEKSRISSALCRAALVRLQIIIFL